MWIFARLVNERELCHGTLVLVFVVRAGNEDAVDLAEEGEQQHKQESNGGHCDDEKSRDALRRLLFRTRVEWIEKLTGG
jgi:hypothetical protein